jgi:DNA adenine methylase
MYFEPFLGGGALFFHLVEGRHQFSAALSDVNEELINTYRVVRNRVEDLIMELQTHKTRYRETPEEYYYETRAKEFQDDVRKAARLIFLNKTCYNGLYRVNRDGEFNVPFGTHKNPRICDRNNLRAASQALRLSKAELVAADYLEATKEADKGDFVYFDPPYQPSSSTAYFTSYTESGFSLEEQERLRDWFEELDNRGCQIVLSNSDTKEIADLYKQHYIQKAQAPRTIGCRGERRKGYKELIIRNFKI